MQPRFSRVIITRHQEHFRDYVISCDYRRMFIHQLLFLVVLRN